MPIVWFPLDKSLTLEACAWIADGIDKGRPEQKGCLYVRFIRGPVWTYHQVPREVYDSLKLAPSPGMMFNMRIRGCYDSAPYFAGDET